MKLVRKFRVSIAIVWAVGCHVAYATPNIKSYDNLKDFNSISIAGNYALIFTQDKQFNVAIKSNQDLSNINASVMNGVLAIKQDNADFSPDSILTIIISAPKLKQLDLSGKYQAALKLSAASDLTFNAHGQGVASLSGDVHNLVVNTQGHSSLNAKAACANSINLTSEGSLNAVLCATEGAVFNRRNLGQANVVIYGNPKFGKSLGLGEVNVQVKKD